MVFAGLKYAVVFQGKHHGPQHQGGRCPRKNSGDGRPHHPQLGEYPDPVDQGIIQGNIQQHGDDVDNHHRSGNPAPGKKTGKTHADDMNP